MPRIARFRRAEQAYGSPQPTEVDCVWRAFDVGAERFVQLDTFGSGTRKLKGKQSQTLQLDRRAAADLMSILAQAFGLG